MKVKARLGKGGVGLTWRSLDVVASRQADRPDTPA